MTQPMPWPQIEAQAFIDTLFDTHVQPIIVLHTGESWVKPNFAYRDAFQNHRTALGDLAQVLEYFRLTTDELEALNLDAPQKRSIPNLTNTGNIEFTIASLSRQHPLFCLTITAMLATPPPINSQPTGLMQEIKQLNESIEFHEMIFNAVPELIFVKDQHYRLVKVNQAFLALYPPEQRQHVIGYTTFESYEPEERKVLLANDSVALTTGYHETVEQLSTPAGQTVVFLTRKIRVYDKVGTPYILGLATDITEREHLIAKLKNLNESLDEFAFIAAHDLKEPVRGISINIGFLQEDYGPQLPEGAQTQLEKIKTAAFRLSELVDQLLHYSRIEHQQLDPVPVNFKSLIHSITETFLGTPNIEFRLTEDYPTITCDPMIYREVLHNLISNAVKYNQQPKIIITIGYEKIQYNKQSWYQFSVQDNGIGIADKDQKKIFKIFQRLHAKDQFGGGTGSGLTLAKKLLTKHNSDIWVESALGQGSTFFFTVKPIVVDD